MSSRDGDIVRRIWARDGSLWTSSGEEQWLGWLDEARKLFRDLAAAGIDYDDVTETLEREGVQKFIDSFTELKQGIAEKRDALAVA